MLAEGLSPHPDWKCGPSRRDEPEGQEHEHAEREIDCREHPRRGIIEDQPVEPVADEIARVAGVTGP